MKTVPKYNFSNLLLHTLWNNSIFQTHISHNPVKLYSTSVVIENENLKFMGSAFWLEYRKEWNYLNNIYWDNVRISTRFVYKTRNRTFFFEIGDLKPKSVENTKENSYNVSLLNFTGTSSAVGIAETRRHGDEGWYSWTT